uniref:AlNc14C21G2201 protein n=1 Tax=Albugo laibachii Nc14 TaxID=890382 RepID=F0W5N6_9STRA|nr:AlNc14C21G2201 [Albugo laibachii Nc14]|eukprot:CCA16427.1 AlNc14C21G2201 [Albugo laibachii Nc14]
MFRDPGSSAFRACAERVHAHIRGWFGPENSEQIEAVASFKAAAVKLNEKKEAVLSEMHRKFEAVNTEGQQECIVLIEPAMKALENDLAFFQSDRIQKRLSEAWMHEIIETEHVKEKDEEGIDGGNMDVLKKCLKDYIVEESTDLEDGSVYIIDADFVKLFGLDLINFYEDCMHDVEELIIIIMGVCVAASSPY